MEKPVQYTIRNYMKGDEISLAKILSECFGPATPRQLLQYMKREGRQPEEIFVALVDGKPVSHVEVGVKELHHGEGVHLKTGAVGGVCTDSDLRKKGIVTNLMKQALNNAQQKGISNTSLFTGLDLPAHRIYERFGFVDLMTWHAYIKYVDYPFIFARWLREINRSLKDSKIAARKLAQWQKSIVANILEVGALSFRFRKSRFQRLKKLPKQADIEFSTDLQTYAKIVRNVVKWEDAVKAGKLRVKHGEPADVEMLNRVLHWSWDD